MPELLTPDAQILFIRHGQSAANLEPHIINGRGNHHPLSPVGEAQAALVGPWLLEHYGEPDAVLASPAVRTRETARIALEAAGLELPVAIDDDLQELSQGDWTGLLREAVYTPEVYERIKTEQMDFKSPGGESMRDVTARKLRVVEHMPSGNVWAFGHGVAIRCLAGYALGWTHTQIHESRTRVFNTSVTHFSRQAGGLTVPAFGLVGHLPSELQTL